MHMHTQSLLSLTATLAVSLALAACDQTDEPVDPSAPKDGEKDDPEDESGGESEGEAGPSSGADPASGGTGGEGGVMYVPPECEALCLCVEGLGSDRWACGQTCGGGLGDDDPNDRAQCVEGLADEGLSACAAECDAFPEG